MKKIMIALTLLLTIAATGKAMSYEQARNEALFLTDKMAYELNLTDAQYEAAYEINLDYLMGVTSYDDVYSTYWERRNLDMSYILLDWQWNAFCAATYFYRPLYWSGGYWHFAVYARYPHRDYFYFGRPVFYANYRGGHAWHVVGGRGYYYNRREHFRPAGRSHFGMLDRWNRGDYRHSSHNGRHYNGNSHFGGVRNSSTRTTVNSRYDNSHRMGGEHSSGSFGSNHSSGSFGSNHSSGSFGSNHSSGSFGNNHSSDNPRGHSGATSSGSFGSSSRSTTPRSVTNNHMSSSSTSSPRSMSISGSRSGSITNNSRSSGSFGGSRSSGSFSSSTRSSGSFSSSTRSSGSFGGSHSSGSLGSHSGGGSRSSGSFGGHR